VSLPAALVKITIILPRYSEPGQYTATVTSDQDGNILLAHGSATATNGRDHNEVVVTLDLRNIRSGNYFLSLNNNHSQVSYRSSIQIK
jgi:hypothetical protein